MHLNSLKDLGNQDINSKLLHIIDFYFLEEWEHGKKRQKIKGDKWCQDSIITEYY